MSHLRSTDLTLFGGRRACSGRTRSGRCGSGLTAQVIVTSIIQMSIGISAAIARQAL
jgi:hypothetical protein